MAETFAAAPGAAGNSNEGVAALSRLTERLNAGTPPPAASPLAAPAPLNARFSPAVSAALAAEADRRARRSRSITGALVRGIVTACAFIAYALVATRDKRGD